MENKNLTNNPSVPQSRRFGIKAGLITVLIAMLAAAGIWFFKSVEVKKVKDKAEQEREALEIKVRHEVLNIQEENLRAIAKPFVWALRKEMMEGNYRQINLYMQDFVKEKSFQTVVVTDKTGKILASTNKKNEGKPFSTIGNIDLLKITETSTNKLNDSTFVLTSPVMGFNSRLGTLYLEYKIQKALN